VCGGGRVTALERSSLFQCRAVCALSIPEFASRTVLRTWHSCEPGAVLGPLVDGGKPGTQSDWMMLNPVERVGCPWLVDCGMVGCRTEGLTRLGRSDADLCRVAVARRSGRTTFERILKDA